METLPPFQTPPPPAPLPPRRRKFLPALIITILLALIGSGGFAYTVIFEAPRAAITKSFVALAAASSFHQETTVKAALVAPAALSAEGTIVTDVVRAAGGGGGGQTATAISGRSGGFSVGAEIRFLDGTLYGRISEFPLLPLLVGSATGSPIGKWYSVSLGEIERYAAEQGVDSTAIAKVKSQINNFGQENITSQLDSLIQNGILLPGRRPVLIRADGVWARQYTVAIDKEKLAGFISAKEKEFLSDIPAAAMVDSPAVADSLKSVTLDPLIVTIGLFDHSLKKIAGGFKFSGENSTPAGVAGRGSASFIIAYRDVNKPIVVAEPENAVSLLEYVRFFKNNGESADGV